MAITTWLLRRKIESFIKGWEPVHIVAEYSQCVQG